MIFKTSVLSLIGGALVTGIFLSLYAATNYVVPLENGEVLEEAAGWRLDPDLFARFLLYALPGSLLIFLVVGSFVYRLLKTCRCLGYSMVLLSGAIVGFVVTFVFNQDITILIHGANSVIVAIGATVSWILHKRSNKSLEQSTNSAAP